MLLRVDCQSLSKTRMVVIRWFFIQHQNGHIQPLKQPKIEKPQLRYIPFFSSFRLERLYDVFEKFLPPSLTNAKISSYALLAILYILFYCIFYIINTRKLTEYGYVTKYKYAEYVER